MQTERLHAACDECRTRKLKCSGDTPTCTRCERESIRCVYSPQKPMGRPRKRRRENGASEQATEIQSENTSTPNSFTVPAFSDIGLISADEINELSAYAEFQPNGDLSNALLPTSYPEAPLASGFGQAAIHDLDFNLGPIDLAIDPLLWQQPLLDSVIDTSTTATTTATPSHSSGQLQLQPQTQPENGTETGPCTCFSIMYLTIADLQSLTNLSFPAVMPRLRQAMNTATEIINCQRCPQNIFSSIQNVQSVSAVLFALAERFHTVLRVIDREAQELQNKGKKKPFRVGDSTLENSHLHTGTPDCPMGFEIQLEASDWKKFAKQALKTEVLGGGSNKTPLISVLHEMEKRQRRWHADEDMQTEERVRIFGAPDSCKSRGDTATCLRMVQQVRRMIDTMDWD